MELKGVDSMPTFLVRIKSEVEIEADTIEEAEEIYKEMDMNALDYCYEIVESD